MNICRFIYIEPCENRLYQQGTLDYNKAIMEIKTDIKNVFNSDNDTEIAAWDHRYATGIKLVDDQHRELVTLTNQLYKACRTRDGTLGNVFKETMHKMVEYVHFHFTAENELLERSGYPEYPDHKKEHDSLIKDILTSVKSYEDGNKFVPNSFVRTLKEWIFGHIAIKDHLYATYIRDQMNKGLLAKNFFG